MTFHAVRAHVMRGAACSPRKRSARRAARDVSIRLVLPFALLQMIVSLLFPCGAVALSPNDQGVLWGPTSLGGGNSGVVVSATNNFDAALWAIGRWSTKIQLDNNMFARLSNQDTGGHFYELASYFHSYSEVGTPNWPNAAAVEGYAISLGSDNVWLATVPDGLIADARNDYNTVLNGGSLGGGSSGDAYTLTLQQSGVVLTNNKTNLLYRVDGVVYSVNDYKIGSDEGSVTAPNTLSFDFSNSETKALVEDRLSRGWHLYVYAYPGALSSGTDNSPLYFNVLLCNTTASVYPVEYSVGGVTWRSTNIKVDYDDTKSYYIAKSKFATDYSANMTWVDSDSFLIGGKLTHVSSSASFSTSGFASPRSTGRNVWINYEVSGPTLPPNNWPTDDPTPTPDPPEVPGPSDDPIPQPDPPDLPNPGQDPVVDPYTPDPDPPVNPVITYDPDPTGDATDYRPWLNAILVLLRKINTTISDGFGDLRGYLTNHCDHIREQIHSDTVNLGLKVQASINNGFVSFERWLQGTYSGYFFDQVDYLLGENFRELESYLYDLFQWLAEQFDFTFGGNNYDDSSVIYWLRRIYARLGVGAPNPGDDGTVDDGFDWWAWLLGLITDALGGIITDFVGDVGGFLATLADVFPFSIPGDIVAYLTLLDAARETPRFVVTIPAIQGWWPSFDYEIDLAPFDDAMGVVRGMFLIYWGLVLVMKTDWLGGVFDFATRAVVQFFDKITGGAYSA